MNSITRITMRMLALALLVVAIGGNSAWAQFQPGIQMQQRIFMGRANFNAPNFVAQDDSGPVASSGAATLENDPEMERLLVRAKEAIDDHRYDLAIVLVQKVLDGANGMPFLKDKRPADERGLGFEIFHSVHEQAEELARRLPAEGLRLYRLTADGEAKGLLAAQSANEREAALAEVVRRYFLSSYGDDAAFEWGCLLLDRYEFIAANRLFEKILRDHPDPSVPREQVLVRLAVSNARLGDLPRAAAALTELDGPAAARLSRGLLDTARQELKRTGSKEIAASREPSGWPMTLGAPARDGHMPALLADVLRGTQAEAWSSKIDLPAKRKKVAAEQANAAAPPVAQTQTPDAETLAKRWAQSESTPAGQGYLEDGRLYFRTPTQVRCLDATTGEMIFTTPEIKPDAAQGQQVQMPNQFRGRMAVNVNGVRRSSEDTAAFADRLTNALTLADGVVYELAPGKLPLERRSTGQDQGPAGPQEAQPPAPVPPDNGQPVSNRCGVLMAFTARGAKPKSGGKLLWQREANDDPAGQHQGARFAAPPVPCGKVLAIAVREGAALWAYGLAPQDGSTVWKTFLCETNRGLGRWQPVALAADAGDLYVSGGCGVVFCLDGTNGALRWCTRYTAAGETKDVAENQQQAGQVDFSAYTARSLDEDALVAHGRALVVLPADVDFLFALDRRTGDVVWISPKQTAEGAVRYCLGVVGDDLVVAGTNCVRKYRLAGGRLAWNVPLAEPSLGRGALTSDAVYVPVKDSIVKIDLASGKTLRQVGVVSDDGRPVGNLYSDGRKLFVMGPDRLAALEAAKAVAPPGNPPPGTMPPAKREDKK